MLVGTKTLGPHFLWITLCMTIFSSARWPLNKCRLFELPIFRHMAEEQQDPIYCVIADVSKLMDTFMCRR